MNFTTIAFAAALLLGQVPDSMSLGVRAPAATQQPGNAQDSLLEARTREVATQLRCPVCQGLSLQDSPSELAQEMRSLIKDQLRSGKSPAQVRAYFVSKYGEWILLQPEPHGFNLAVYLLPVLGILLGGSALLLAARRWTRAPLQVEAEQPTASSSSDPS